MNPSYLESPLSFMDTYSHAVYQIWGVFSRCSFRGCLCPLPSVLFMGRLWTPQQRLCSGVPQAPGALFTVLQPLLLLFLRLHDLLSSGSQILFSACSNPTLNPCGEFLFAIVPFSVRISFASFLGFPFLHCCFHLFTRRHLSLIHISEPTRRGI